MKKEELRELALTFQRSEITEHLVYRRLAEVSRHADNKKVLRRIANDELRHYDFWKNISGEDVKPDLLKVWFYYLISRFLGLTFGVRLMEKGEHRAQKLYKSVSKYVPGVNKIIKDEHAHELKLLRILDDERLKYVGSIVLGLNDALVELTGALAGFTLALQNTRLISVVGLITGIAAALSMAASEYLSTKAEENNGKHPVRASIYTGITYMVTVLFLVLPFWIFQNVFVCLGSTILIALFAIFLFTFYTHIAMGLPFRKRFFEMALLSMGIAAFSFLVGYFMRLWFGVSV